MEKYRFAPYYKCKILRKCPYIQRDWCIKIIENPLGSKDKK